MLTPVLQASSQFAPLGWFHGAKSTFNTVSDTYVVKQAGHEIVTDPLDVSAYPLSDQL
jgi:hypothetical protein